METEEIDGPTDIFKEGEATMAESTMQGYKLALKNDYKDKKKKKNTFSVELDSRLCELIQENSG